MPIDTACTGCGKALRVPDEHAGRRARCPICGTIYTVPESSDHDNASPKPTAKTHAGDDRWYMKTPEGQIYGPVDKGRLDGWLSEGRVTAECQLRTSEDSQWQRADEFYGVLRPNSASPQSGRSYSNRGSHRQSRQYSAPGSRTAGTSQSPFASRQHLVPHRGAIILVLGILGWVFTCPIFSIAAWVMGSSDLREMRSGRMDPSGTGLTQAGRVLGMIYSLIWIAFFVIAMFVLILVAASGGF